MDHVSGAEITQGNIESMHARLEAAVHDANEALVKWDNATEDAAATAAELTKAQADLRERD